jgi:hypothetical protein
VLDVTFAFLLASAGKADDDSSSKAVTRRRTDMRIRITGINFPVVLFVLVSSLVGQVVQIGTFNFSPKNVTRLWGCVGLSGPVYIQTTALLFVASSTVLTEW